MICDWGEVKNQKKTNVVFESDENKVSGSLMTHSKI